MDTSSVCREKYHENELLTLYCKKCKVCICDKCRQTRHNHHTTVDIYQAAEQHKVDIEDILQDMKRELDNYKERAEKAKESLKESRERIATARNKVMTSVGELIRLLEEHETAMITRLDVFEEKEQREHAAQLEHFQISMNQLQKQVESCEGILLRRKSVEILQVHHVLIARCRGLLNAEKLYIYKPSHVRYQINEEHIKNVRSAVTAVGRFVVSNTNPELSMTEGTGLKNGNLGKEATIKITTKDFDGNWCYDDMDQIHVQVQGAIHSTKLSGIFGPKLNGSVRSNRKSFEKTGPPFEVVLFARSDRLEFRLNGSRPQSPSGKELNHFIARGVNGAFHVTYTPVCVGQHEVLIAVNGELLPGNPWRVHVTAHRYKYHFSFGSIGERRGQPAVDWPVCIAIDDNSKNVAVADLMNGVQLFSSEGKYMGDISTNQLNKPTSVAFSKSSELIVTASDKIFCFDKSYQFVKLVTNEHIKSPHCLTIAGDGRMMVCDSYDDTVKVLSSDGTQLLLTITDPDSETPCYAVCCQNKFFVSYYEAGNVKVFSKDREFPSSIGTPDPSERQLSVLLALQLTGSIT